MVFTWEIFTNLAEKEIIILISSERHEIAKRLRMLASHAPADAELVNDLLGLYPGEYIDGYDPCNVQHLADLIEPEERTCRIEGTYSDEYAIYDHLTCGHVNLRHWHEPTSYCSTCGAKVVK